MWEDLRLTEDLEWIVESLQNKSLVCVTDGSYDKQRAPDVCSAGWIMKCRRTGRQISGSLVEVSPSAGSYRGEMLGMLAIRLLLLAVEEYFGAITKDNRICCDNKGAIFTFEKKSKRVTAGKSNADIRRVLRSIKARTRSSFLQSYDKGHQDNVKRWSDMTYEERLNSTCDRMAKDAITNHILEVNERRLEALTAGERYKPEPHDKYRLPLWRRPASMWKESSKQPRWVRV